jgi:serine phosphatase RsbU (regulator of sigma subunit)/type II secretory pathway pseudopilin PulG
MELAVRRFARNILLIHLGLLALVLAMVFFASRAIRESAREQALRQAQSRQELLASQTARGVEGFYQSILSDLDLLPPTETSSDERALVNSLTSTFSRPAVAAARQAAKQLPTGPNGQRRTPPKMPITTRRGLLGPLLARQLEERADYLFLYKKDQNAAIDVSSKPEEGDPRSAPADSPEGRIVTAFSSFLKDVNAPAISPFQMVDGRGINLVCQPLPQVKDVVVAVVSVEKINQLYLQPLNGDPSRGGALLINNDLMTMAASRPDLVGVDLAHEPDPRFHDALDHFRDTNYQGWQVLDHRFTVGSESFEPAVVTAVPIDVPGKRWFVMVSSPLGDVDSVVSSLFHRIVGWAIFVVVAMSGILVSTAVQMIRSRVKLERFQHEVLTRELERARQIQQAWLPRTAPASRWLDIAAVNYPAQHISGDFYNWFDLPDGRTAVVIGDVTGHGMSAAFLMATTQLLVRSTMERMEDPGKCLAEVNRLLCTQAFNGQFVTMQLLVIDPTRRTIELATAGHPAPLLAEAVSNGQPTEKGTAANLPAVTAAPPTNTLAFRPLKLEPQLVLGVEADTTYDTEHFTLPVGATLLLYTDGAADVQAPDGRRFGNDGLRRSLSPTPGRHNGEPHPSDKPADARALLETVVRAVNDFRGTEALGDDLTLVAVRVAGSPRPAPAAKRAATMALP